MTAGWDKTLRYWDARTPSPQFVLNLPERVQAMDVKYPVMVVATADKKFYVFNLDNPQTPFRVRSGLGCGRACARCLLHMSSAADRHLIARSSTSTTPTLLPLRAQEMTYKTPMKMQARCVKLFANRQMFAVGSIEGRVQVRCVDEAMDNA